MINIDFLTLKAFLVENIDFFIGGRLQKIQQPTRRDFVFSIRNNGKSRKLYINISPQTYHTCFMSQENEDKRHLEIPKHPPMFCMLLRKYLEGCRIYDTKVVDNERILEFHFEIIDELSEKRSLCLCIELMGKHSNIILYDRDSSIIIGCAHNVGTEKSRYRELQGGLKYIYPPKTNSQNYLSKELEEEFKNITVEKRNNYLKTEDYRPAILDDKYTLFQELIPNSIIQNSVNEMIDKYYSNFQQNLIIKNEKNRLLNIIKPKLKKTTNSISKINNLLEKRDNTDKYKLYGELLTANIYQNKDYMQTIELYDYINNKNIIIDLDKTLTLKENAQRYYKLYTKSKNTKEKSLNILENLNIDKIYLENILYSLAIAENFEDILEIQNEIEPMTKTKNKSNKDNRDKILKLNINNFEVYIGRNNKQNDYIISKLAKDNDYWFHTRLCAGSHVLLKTDNKDVNEEVLFKCCELARKYSSATQPSKVGIIYTLAKNLRKPPASPLGYVTYKNEKEILI